MGTTGISQNGWIDKLLAGDARVAARLITMVESGAPAETARIVKDLYPHTGRAHVVGVTGAPGVGKSTLVDRLIALLCQNGLKIGVIAVDPSSPFSGGAILGDRVRMQSHATEPGVFIRSMASRGHWGGLSTATRNAVRVLDAMGKDIIVIETIGVGQGEIAIADEAETTVLVLSPGAGDSIQMMKAGIMEIGDIFVVNKSDREGADETVMEVEAMLMLDSSRDWKPPVIKTKALPGEGIEELWEKVEAHRRFLTQNPVGRDRRLRHIREEIMAILIAGWESTLWSKLQQSDYFSTLLERVEGREMDPYAAAVALSALLVEEQKINFKGMCV